MGRALGGVDLGGDRDAARGRRGGYLEGNPDRRGRHLEKRGLLERRTHPEDGRRVLLRLSRPGLALMAELFPVFNKQETLVVQSLSADEIRVLAAALRKIVVDMEGTE